MRKTRRKWTLDEIAKLRKLANENTPLAVISMKLRRTQDALRQKLAIENISLRPKNQRPYAEREAVIIAESVPGGFAAQVTSTVRARGNAYGSPAENHQTTADMYSLWLSRRLKLDIKLTAEDVIALNVIQKMSRLAFCSKDDSWLDVAGYTENIAMIRPDQRNNAPVASKRFDSIGLNGTK